MLIVNLKAGRRDAAEEQVAAACVPLHRAGADFLVVTSGTTSTLTGKARGRISIPFLDPGESTWSEVTVPGPVGLLATSYAAKGGIFHAGAAAKELVEAGAKTILLRNTDMTQAAEQLRGACVVPMVDAALAHARAAARKAVAA